MPLEGSSVLEEIVSIRSAEFPVKVSQLKGEKFVGVKLDRALAKRKMGSMDGYSGLLPFVWKKVRKYRFRDTYQHVNRRYYPRSRRRAIKSTRMGKRSWGLKMPKLRISIVSPSSFCKRMKDMYMRMVMSLTGKKTPNRLGYGNQNGYVTKSSSRTVEETPLDPSVIYLDYLMPEDSLISTQGYAKWSYQ